MTRPVLPGDGLCSARLLSLRDNTAMAILASLIALAVTVLYGGWEWALLILVVLVTLWPAQFSVVPMLTTMGVSFFWFALFRATGDRRLFFPYAMQFAVQMPYLLQGRVSRPAIVGGGGVVAVFALIRLAQSATVGVLVVELFVAAAIVALVSNLYGPNRWGVKTRVISGIIGSVLAFAGLAL